MNDWQKKLSNHYGGGSGGVSMKKCACGAPIKDERFNQCYQCSQKNRGNQGNAYAATVSTLPKGYLEGGYFENKDGKKYIKEEIFITWAREVSAALKAQGLTAAAIRRFFSKLRAVEYKYKTNHDFNLAREGIYAFVRDVSYTENRGVTPALFSRFIEANVEQAKNDAEHFRAFVEHFQSVVAYFKDK
jgi:CRISPR-associated protein Csm2